MDFVDYWSDAVDFACSPDLDAVLQLSSSPMQCSSIMHIVFVQQLELQTSFTYCASFLTAPHSKSVTSEKLSAWYTGGRCKLSLRP